MTWTVKYHPAVQDDLDALGRADAKTALNVIEKRIRNGEPDKLGNPLRSDLVGCRRIRTGDIRIIYQVINETIEILIVAIGARRNKEAYKKAIKRHSIS